MTRVASHCCDAYSRPLQDTTHLPLQCTELSVTNIPSAAATAAAASTAISQCDDASFNERPANSLHEPSGGPSTSDASSKSESPSQHALSSLDPAAALPHTASVNSARSSAAPEGTFALTHNSSAIEGDAASGRRDKPLADSGSQRSSEAETAISGNTNSQHSTCSDRSSSSSSSSSSISSSSSKGDSSPRQETSGKILHCHIDWDKDDVGSHDVAVNDGTGATDSPPSNQITDDAPQKSYVVLSVSLKNGKASGNLAALSWSMLLQHDTLYAVALHKMQQTF